MRALILIVLLCDCHYIHWTYQ